MESDAGIQSESKYDGTGITALGLDAQKKTFGAIERDEVERLLFADVASTLPVERVVVVDESSTHLGMTPRYARAPRGQRAFAHYRRNYGQNITLLSAMHLGGMGAAMVVEGATTTAVFEAYVEHLLAPTLHPGDIVLLDNLAAHKSDKVAHLILARGARLLFLPAYSPDFSPIEHAFSKIKQFLRHAQAQTLPALIVAILNAFASVSWDDTIGWFTHCGFLNLA